MVADIEDMGKLQKSILEDSQCKRSVDATKGWTFDIPSRRWNTKIVRKRLRIPKTHSKAGSNLKEREDFSGELQGELEESQPIRTTDDAEARADFWSIQGDFIYRHHNEPRVQVSRTTHTSLYCTKNVSAMIGTLMWIEFCQIHEQDSRSSHYWTKTLPKEKRRQRCDSQGCKPDLIICGLKFGPACRKQLRKRRSGNGPLKSQSSMTRWEAFISLIRMIKSSNPLQTQGKVGEPDGSCYAL